MPVIRINYPIAALRKGESRNTKTVSISIPILEPVAVFVIEEHIRALTHVVNSGVRDGLIDLTLWVNHVR